MDKLPMCRICLAENVRMYIVVNKNLHVLYEKLTDIPFVTEDSRPTLACFFCCAKLKQCYRLLRQCLEAEERFAQMMNEDYEHNPLINKDHLEVFSGFIKSPTENISIVDECQTESIAIKEELPAVCERLYDIIEPKEEHQSDELELENLDNSCIDVADIPAHASESHSEDDVTLMEFKTEVEDEQEASNMKRSARETKNGVTQVPVNTGRGPQEIVNVYQVYGMSNHSSDNYGDLEAAQPELVQSGNSTPVPVVSPVPSATIAPSAAPQVGLGLPIEAPTPPAEVALPGPTTETLDDETVPSLKPEVLELLGEDPTSNKKYGENLHKDIATRWAHILTNGLSRDIQLELVKRYLPPENCPNMRVPMLNLEIKAALLEINLKKDLYSQSKQSQLSSSLAAIGQVLNWALSSKNAVPQDILKTLSDAGRLICDSHYRESQSRRYAALNTLNKNIRDTVKNTKIDENLFGSDLAEHIKSSKAIIKTGSEMKSAVVRPAYKPTVQQQRGTLNSRGGPPRVAAAAEPRPPPAPRRPPPAPRRPPPAPRRPPPAPRRPPPAPRRPPPAPRRPPPAPRRPPRDRRTDAPRGRRSTGYTRPHATTRRRY